MTAVNLTSATEAGALMEPSLYGLGPWADVARSCADMGRGPCTARHCLRRDDRERVSCSPEDTLRQPFRAEIDTPPLLVLSLANVAL